MAIICFNLGEWKSGSDLDLVILIIMMSVHMNHGFVDIEQRDWPKSYKMCWNEFLISDIYISNGMQIIWDILFH